jgi:hypothetical protein
MLIVVPIITLLAISGFRMAHYFHNNFGFEMEFFELAVVGFSFAFETWYLWFGLVLLKDYFKVHFFKNEFYMSQWGLICPFVAFAVLGSFVYKLYIPNVIVYSMSLLSGLVAVSLFALILRRYVKCKLSQNNPNPSIACVS